MTTPIAYDYKAIASAMAERKVKSIAPTSWDSAGVIIRIKNSPYQPRYIYGPNGDLYTITMDIPPQSMASVSYRLDADAPTLICPTKALV